MRQKEQTTYEESHCRQIRHLGIANAQVNVKLYLCSYEDNPAEHQEEKDQQKTEKAGAKKDKAA